VLKYIATGLLLAGVAIAQAPLLPKVSCNTSLPNGFTCANVYAVRWLTPPPLPPPSPAPADTPHKSDPIVRGSNVYVPPRSEAPNPVTEPAPAIHAIMVIIGSTLYEAEFNPPLSGLQIPDGVAALASNDWLVLSLDGKDVVARIMRREKLRSNWRWYDPSWKRNRNLPLDQ